MESIESDTLFNTVKSTEYTCTARMDKNEPYQIQCTKCKKRTF
jgi:hypothetical protein